MVKLEREDIEAALLLSWLKYTPVDQKDVENMKNVREIEENEPEILGKSKRKLLRIKKNENPETPDFQLSKRVKNSSSGSSNFSKKNPETPEVYGAGSSKKKPETHEAGSSSRNSNPNPKKGRVLPMNLPGSLPKFPPIENLRTLIGQCSNPCVKQLTKSDVEVQQGRLLLNNEYVRKQFLPLLNEETEDLGNGIKVKTFDPMGKSYNMTFKTWGNHKCYLLLGSWKQFVQEHRLKEGDRVTIWMFRHNQTGELCFALTW